MNCLKCGYELTDGTRFCINCGAKVEPVITMDTGDMPLENQDGAAGEQPAPAEQPVAEETVCTEEAPAEPVAEETTPAEPAAEEPITFTTTPQEALIVEPPKDMTEKQQPGALVGQEKGWPGLAKGLVIGLGAVAAVLLAILLVTGGRNTRSRKTLQAQVTSLTEQADALQAENDALTQELQEQVKDLSSLSETLDATEQSLRDAQEYNVTLEGNLQDTLKDLEEKEQLIKDMRPAAEKGIYYDTIVALLQEGKLGSGSKNYFANQSIVVMSASDTNGKKITVTSKMSGSYQLTFVSENRFVTQGEFGKQKGNTFPVTIKPVAPGLDVYTFTNNKNSDTFKVIIIVTE